MSFVPYDRRRRGGFPRAQRGWGVFYFFGSNSCIVLGGAEVVKELVGFRMNIPLNLRGLKFMDMGIRKIVVAADSFKGCLSSMEVASAVEAGVRRVLPGCEVRKVDVADGGEGTVDAVVGAMCGRKVAVGVHDPLGRAIEAAYGLVETRAVMEPTDGMAVTESADGTVETMVVTEAESVGVTAVIEMAAASGLTLLKAEERNPMVTSTYGTGELILDALGRGCRRFLVGIGGSATNDAGTGMLAALGFRFLDGDGRAVRGCGETLREITEIDDSSVAEGVRESEFIVACDVDTPFCGPEGAAYVFGPQKGASHEDVRRLDDGMRSFARVIRAKYGTDVVPVKGAGAAGGLGGAFKVFLGAGLVRGVDMVLDAVGFDKLIEGADLVVTGEGRIDSQTVKGKVVTGVVERAKKAGVPVVAIGGSVEDSVSIGDGVEKNEEVDGSVTLCAALREMGLAGIYSVNPPGTPLEIAMRPDFARERISATVERILGLA